MHATDFGNAEWHKSTYSNGGGACIEVATSNNTTAIRDSKLGDGSSPLPLDLLSWGNLLGILKKD